jgi:excisionase family DNA binding protein
MAKKNEFFDDEIMDIKETSQYLKVRERTLYTLAKAGKIPGIKIGGQWRFKKVQLDSLFNPPAPETGKKRK